MIEMIAWMRLFAVFVIVGTLAACGSSSRKDTLFTLLPSSSTGVTFVNDVEDQPEKNVLTDPNFYNGGGVAAGDVNNDGRPDLYFTANMNSNALYLNQGDFRFEDVTKEAGVRDAKGWTTGVTMADVNGDGFLDIYVCKSGPIGTEPRSNKLYVNDGDGTFTERAAAYGIGASTYSTHATFFDYDRDGDLDLYLLNNPPVRDPRLGTQSSRQWQVANDRLYRNDTDASGAPSFVDVTGEAGLQRKTVGYGLSATVSDINRDGWPDVYVGNDYEVEDRLYINQGDGTFTDAIHDWVDYMSVSSMGADVADYNNDARPDLFVADMLAEDNRRRKLLRLSRRFTTRKTYQYVRNMLQLHNGDGTFSEIGQLAGVSNTDWSWAALFADFDLDGFKDLYVTNGIRYDYTDMDFQLADYLPALRASGGGASELYTLIEKMPSTPIPNYLFRNQGDLTFAKKSTAWGVAQKGFSSGAAYVDLDRDGDLDLAVNNINEPAWVYRNNAREQTNRHYLRVELEGEGANGLGIGAKVTLTTPRGQTLFQEAMPARGFQSSVEPVLSFGLGEAETVGLTVIWPDQTRQRIAGVRADQTITLQQGEAHPYEGDPQPQPDQHLEAVQPDRRGLAFEHRENPYKDYRHEPLMPHMLARLGPALARGDVNSDGREDVFIGGARGQRSALFVQGADGSFSPVSVEAFEADRAFEDVAAAFVDINGDGHQDLYVVSGGKAEVRPDAYQDRVYLNDGTGTLKAAPDVVPTIESSGGAVAAHDYDGDGDQDLFVGGRVHVTEYPLAPRSYLLENTGGQLKDVTAKAAEALRRPGMVTDAGWYDLVGDATKELLLAGEWMPLRVFQHEGGGAFTEVTGALGLDGSNGWWNRLAVADLDGDGDRDIVAGNRGENAQLQARSDAPVSVYAGDFDQDGHIEPVMSYYMDGTEYPVPRRGRLMAEISILRARFPTYESYAGASMKQVLTEEQREKAQRLKAYTFTTSVFEQQKEGTFARRDLPVEAQFSPTRGIIVEDVNGDDRPDVLLAGNDFTVRHPWGPSEAGKGVLLLNQGDLAFEAQRAHESGFFAPGDVRDLLLVSTPDPPLVVVANNNAACSLFAFRSSSQTKIAER